MKPKTTKPRIRDGATRLESLYCDTMEQCAAMTGIPKSLQQLAKSQGSPAFKGARVYPLELMKWLFAQSGTAVDWRGMNPELDAKLKWVELQQDMGRLVERTEVESLMAAWSAVFFGALKRRDFEMRDKTFIKGAMEDKVRTVTASIEAQLEKFRTDAPKLEQPKVTT